MVQAVPGSDKYAVKIPSPLQAIKRLKKEFDVKENKKRGKVPKNPPPVL